MTALYAFAYDEGIARLLAVQGLEVLQHRAEFGVLEHYLDGLRLERYRAVDETGLDDMDKRILSAIIEKFSGGPVGLSSLAVAVGEERQLLQLVNLQRLKGVKFHLELTQIHHAQV